MRSGKNGESGALEAHLELIEMPGAVGDNGAAGRRADGRIELMEVALESWFIAFGCVSALRGNVF